MTEKRFKATDNTDNPFLCDWSVTDYADGGIVHHPMTSENMANVMCELLNELNDENEQLKSRISDYDKALKTLQDLTDRKLKENEQLKQQNRLLKGKLHRLRMEKGRMEEEIECLSEETVEQFKKDLQNGEFIELTARPQVRKHENDHIGWKGDVE